jgi:GT2 family glycosyltransferase
MNTTGGRPLRPQRPATKVLVAGWFSFPYHHATAGDLLACEVACGWLEEAGIPYDVALGAPFDGGVDWRAVAPRCYSHLVFVCGPVGPSHRSVVELVDRFEPLTRVAVNVTMQEPLEGWNPFDILIERDSVGTTRPDLTFGSLTSAVPVLGVVLVEPYAPEQYPGRDAQRSARDAIHRLLHMREAVLVPIDTRLDVNTTGLRTPAEVESLIARMDAVVTTRLHGLVLALKNGVPALAIDPVIGGGKIRMQAEHIGWPAVFTSEALSEVALSDVLDFCLSEEGRRTAAECAARAASGVETTRSLFLRELDGADGKTSGIASRGQALFRGPRTTVPATVVVVARKRRQDLLTDCLESIAACAPRPDEILVVDTTHDAETAAHARGLEIGGLRIIAAPQASRGVALNTALRLAGNEIVLIAEDDCVVSASWVAVGWSRVTADPDVFFTGQILPLDDSRRAPTNMHAPRPQLLMQMTNWGEVAAWVMAFNRRRLLEMGGFDERSPMAEDLDLRYRLHQDESRLEYEPDLVVWRQSWRTEHELRELARISAVERGAFYAKHLRQRDLGVGRLAAADLRAGVRGLAAALRHRKPSWSDPRRGILHGLPRGLAQGWRPASKQDPSFRPYSRT